MKRLLFLKDERNKDVLINPDHIVRIKTEGQFTIITLDATLNGNYISVKTELDLPTLKTAIEESYE